MRFSTHRHIPVTSRITYRLINKPWEFIPILLRAFRFSKARLKIRDAEHIAWAESLIGRTPRETAVFGYYEPDKPIVVDIGDTRPTDEIVKERMRWPGTIW